MQHETFKMVTFRADRQDMKMLRHIAIDEGRTYSDVLRRIIKAKIKYYEQKKVERAV